MNELLCKNKGEIAMLKVQLKAQEKGYVISLPTTEERYDCIIDDGKKLYKTQIKYLNGFNFGEKGKRENCLRLRLGGGNCQKIYNKEEIDYFLLYLPIKDVVVSVPVEKFHNKTSISFNLDKPSLPSYYKNFLW